MEWIERLNQALKYIEEHLTEDVDYEQAAHVACCSVYHFQRMFSYLAGVPLSEYIRRRRMSLAAVDLQAEGAKVMDIALKYGYDSPTAFNRAFQSVHGVAPSQAKHAGAALKAYPPISFQITVKGVAEMEYRIEKKESFQIVGLSAPMEKEIEKNFAVVPQMWGKAASTGALEKLIPLMEEPKGVLGVSACGENEDWQYFIAVASSQPAAEEWDTYTVSAPGLSSPAKAPCRPLSKNWSSASSPNGCLPPATNTLMVPISSVISILTRRTRSLKSGCP